MEALSSDTTNNMAPTNEPPHPTQQSSNKATSEAKNVPLQSALPQPQTSQPTTEESTLTEFTLFPKLPLELREIIFKFALPTGHCRGGTLSINLQTTYEYDDSFSPVLRSTGLDFSIWPGGTHVHPQLHDFKDLSLSIATRESRKAYLSVFSRRLALTNGVVHFSPDTTIYLPRLCYILVDDEIETLLATLTQPNAFTTAVDHLAGPYYTFGATFNPKLSTAVSPEKLNLWIGFLTNFKSLTMVDRMRRYDYGTMERHNHLSSHAKTAFEQHQKKFGGASSQPKIKSLFL